MADHDEPSGVSETGNDPAVDTAASAESSGNDGEQDAAAMRDSGDAAAPDAAGERHCEAAARATAPRRRDRLRKAGVLVTALVALAAAITSGYLAHHHRAARTADDQRLAYVQAAQQEVLNVLTVHYDSAGDDVQRILDDATGQWRAEFAPQAQPFTAAVQQAKVITTAEIAGAGLEHVNDDGSALVLLTAHSKVSNSAGAHEEPRTFRVRVTVAPDGSRLKISKMEYVAS